jgi:DNA-binding NarL/FixJ family response regulator
MITSFASRFAGMGLVAHAPARLLRVIERGRGLAPPPGLPRIEVLRLMIVDDNARTRSALAACLAGISCLKVIGEACDGQDAIDKLQTLAPDLVLMDCRMPRMTGLEATRILKRQWPTVKIVILTLYPDCDPEARAAGADALLTKGCSLEELTSTLRAVAAG